MATMTTAGGKRRSRSEGESDRAGSEHAASPAPSSRSSTKQQIRHRASIACASCRERRIRCVVGEGESECAQCRRTGSTCIIKDDDERRRPISKAYMSSLSNRIALLEEMLKERGVVPPPAVHPPKTRQEAQARQQQEKQQTQAGEGERSRTSEPYPPPPLPANHPATPPGSGDEDVVMFQPEQSKSLPTDSHTALACLIDPVLLQDVEPKKDASTRHLLCARGSYIHDQSVGRTRFFGPTANIHLYSRSTSGFAPFEQPEHIRRAERLIAALRPSTHDHLMRCFWDYYNPWQQVVDEAAFEAGRTAQDPRFYSLLLHLAMLAIGYRFADWDREDVKRATLGSRESTLHRKAKSMLEAELERPGGIPTVQALLLLADLECGVGRDTTGWMYSGMANRLGFDIGLHVNPSGADLSELERQTRRQVMSACVMFDRKWALLLGRPTTIKSQDINVDVLPKMQREPLVDSSLGTVASQAAIYRQMFELLELGGKVADFQNSAYGPAHVFSTKSAEDRAYLHFIGLERLFHNWYRRLPENLTWKPVNIKSAPLGFFMLHQQFHVCMILLHRPWARYGPMSLDGSVAARYPSPESPGRDDGTNHLPSWMAPLPHHDNRASLSRSMCTQHAIRVARIFWHHRQRFDGKRVGLSTIQHAGTAAVALMAALAHKSAELDHQSNLRYLQVLSSAIYDMSHLYQPAARMYQLLKTMLIEIRSEMVKSGGFDVSSFVGRYQGSSNSSVLFGSNQWATGTEGSCLSSDRLESAAEDARAVKRRRLSSLSSVDFTTIGPSFLSASHQACPSPPSSSRSHENSNPVSLDQLSNEPNTFDLDFFHSSFVDFINNGGEGASTQDWATTGPSAVNVETTVPMLIPTASGDLSCLSVGTENTVSKPNEPPATATTSPPAAPAAQPASPVPPADDETAVDKTIEEWLAEPAAPTVSTPPDHNTLPQAGTASGNSPQTAELPSVTTTNNTVNAIPTTEEVIHSSQPRSHLAHATADGTPICRDPYVLSLETELGLTLDNNKENAASSGGCAMDWLSTSPPAPSPACPEKEVVDSNTARPPAPPPMTPVTLDELVQSVEEAVGSARARARARAAAAAAAAAGSGGTITLGAGVGCGKGESPVVRNRELDFLAL
ncbi:fungal-specific transcription factor domain-containing protein [Achaetomium macrosporum]|uniref:Fungal-specific transcription factor domain-containing protein n=1 Tax=Achaetomium macrosporum TaxID=79813 RepID=A0AAN7C7A3_9PEZI|nr:fungal-specific transcription factor domain-containing protein [Achaetomium macrosporum]